MAVIPLELMSDGNFGARDADGVLVSHLNARSLDAPALLQKTPTSAAFDRAASASNDDQYEANLNEALQKMSNLVPDKALGHTAKQSAFKV